MQLFIRSIRSSPSCRTAPLPESNMNAALGVAGTAASIGGVLPGFLPTHRQCSIQITNYCSHYTLLNPSEYSFSGGCPEHLPYRLDSNSSGTALFTKTGNTACGAVGVFTYDLIHKSTKEATEKIAVMFSVPYDFNLYSNWYAVGIFDMSTQCNYDLYCKMYYKNDNTFVRKKAGQRIKHGNNRLTIMASMGDAYQPVMKVEVRDD